MGLINDIKNMQPLSNKVITNKEFNKIINDIFKDVEREHKLLQTLEQAGVTKIYRQVGCGKHEFVGFDLGIKDDYSSVIITTPNGCRIAIDKNNINDDVSKVVELLNKETIVENDDKGSVREGDNVKF